MRILFIVQIFESLDDTGSDRHYFFAKKLVEKGYKVNVVTANVDYKKAAKRFNSKFYFRKKIDGIDVTYVPVFTNFRGSFLKRMIFFLSFFISSLIEIIRVKDIDIIYAVSTPLSNGFLGAIFSFLKRAPLFFEVTDVWPDAAIHTGVIKNKFIINLSKLIEKITYKKAKKIICLSEGIKNNISKKGISNSKLILITNGIDVSIFPKFLESDIGLFKKKYDLGKEFLALYLGAHGIYNSLMTIMLTAKEISHIKDIKFVIIGDGDEKIKLQEFAKKNKLKNVKFLGPLERTEAIKILSTANIFLLPNRKGDFFRGNLPNKLFDYLASSKPILVSGFGESSDLVLKANAGKVVEAEDHKDFSRKIINFFKDSKKSREQMGNNGKKFVEENYNRDLHIEILDNLFKENLEENLYLK